MLLILVAKELLRNAGIAILTAIVFLFLGCAQQNCARLDDGCNTQGDAKQAGHPNKSWCQEGGGWNTGCHGQEPGARLVE